MGQREFDTAKDKVSKKWVEDIGNYPTWNGLYVDMTIEDVGLGYYTALWYAWTRNNQGIVSNNYQPQSSQNRQSEPPNSDVADLRNDIDELKKMVEDLIHREQERDRTPSISAGTNNMSNDGSRPSQDFDRDQFLQDASLATRPSPQPTTQVRRYEQGPQQQQPAFGRRREVRETQRLRQNPSQNEAWVPPPEQDSYEASRPESQYATPAQSPEPLPQYGVPDDYDYRQSQFTPAGAGKKAGVYRVI